MIRIENLSKIFKTSEEVHALRSVSTHVEAGDIFGVIGMSGAGKSTVLNILGGMDSCDDGKVRVAGKLINDLSKAQLVDYRRYDVGFIFQFYNLVPNLTALENVELATQMCKKPIKAEKILARVGLKDRMDNFPSQLSGGEQQRVSIARALAKNPKILLCDEPTGALDDVTGKQVLKLLQDTCRKEGMTVIVITHNQAITPMADRVIRMRNGKVQSVTINEKPTPVEEIEW